MLILASLLVAILVLVKIRPVVSLPINSLVGVLIFIRYYFSNELGVVKSSRLSPNHLFFGLFPNGLVT